MKRKASLLVVVVLSVWCNSNAQAGSVPALDITEVTDTLLTYSYMGGAPVSVSTLTPDYWFFTLPNYVVTSVSSDQNVNVNWKENDYATTGQVNWVNFFQNSNGSQITVRSDHVPMGNFEPGYPLVNNGGTYDFYNDGGISLGLMARFTDNADPSESSGVPESGASFILLLISLGTVAAVRQLVARRAILSGVSGAA